MNVALGLAASCAANGAEAGQARATLQVSAVVLARAPEIQVDYQAALLTITPEDIDRGYVEAPAASQFRISAGTPSGWLVDFFARGRLFTSAHVEWLGGSAQLGADGGTVYLKNRTSGSLTRLTYRFALATGVQPGSYQWPLVLFVRSH